MKDYEHQIIWLDYFNKNLSRRKGRRVSKDIAVFDPKVEELMAAAKSVNYEPSEVNQEANFPRRSYVRSAYIMVEKKEGKEIVLRKIGKALLEMRQKAKK